MKYRILLIAEMEDGLVDGQCPETRLDAFREAVQPSQNYGITLFRPSEAELTQALLKNGWESLSDEEEAHES